MSDVLRLPDAVHSFPEALAFWAERTPDAPAIRALDGRTLSHRELHHVVAGVAARLSALGIGGDARVAVVLHGGDAAAVALLGIMSVATAVPINPAATAHELWRDLERLQPALLVTGAPAETTSRAVASELNIPTIAIDELVADDASLPWPPHVAPRGPDDIAVILHTSGTTGFPKRVPRSHRSYVAAARAARDCTNLTSHDVALVTSGLYTNMGLAAIFAALFNGGSCVVTQGFDQAAYPTWLEAYQPTWAVSTYTELTMILDAANAAGREVVALRSRLRAVRTGAQPLAPGIAERAERGLRAVIFDGFGMTEASYITGSGPGTEDRRPGSCGRPSTGAAIRILDQEGEDAPAGTAGEIVIRGPTLFAGYLDDPAANAAAFLPGGWFRTGDLGYLDEKGYLYINGRLNELINRGGEKIAPVEVDHALLSHPAVADAAAFAVPDARLGEDVVAAVVLEPGSEVTARQLRAWLLDRLNRHKAPRRIWIMERIPRTATGKIQRGELTRRWNEERG
jgi:acyl-CoA synthetase (AMP-forming)/AMP-acid ligase II